MVTISESDVLEIIVLSACPHALLRRRSPRVIALFQAEEDVLELVHPSIGEQQRGVVVRDERRRMHLAMSLLNEKVQKFSANFRTSQHAIVEFQPLDSSIGECMTCDGTRRSDTSF